MTFNPTHRLTRPIGVTYVVGEQFQITECGTEGRVHGAFSDDRQVWIMDSEYELLPQEEPVKLEPGKRYRWTVEGTYKEEEEEGHLYKFLEYGGLGGVSLSVDELSWGTVELLPDPLPTTPGSVIAVNGHSYGRSEDEPNGRHWLGLTGSDRGEAWADADFAGDAVVVLFDAGAES